MFFQIQLFTDRMNAFCCFVTFLLALMPLGGVSAQPLTTEGLDWLNEVHTNPAYFFPPLSSVYKQHYMHTDTHLLIGSVARWFPLKLQALWCLCGDKCAQPRRGSGVRAPSHLRTVKHLWRCSIATLLGCKYPYLLKSCKRFAICLPRYATPPTHTPTQTDAESFATSICAIPCLSWQFMRVKMCIVMIPAEVLNL